MDVARLPQKYRDAYLPIQEGVIRERRLERWCLMECRKFPLLSRRFCCPRRSRVRFIFVVDKEIGIFLMKHQIDITRLHSFLRIHHSRPPASCPNSPWLINTCIENDGNRPSVTFACERTDRGLGNAQGGFLLTRLSSEGTHKLVTWCMQIKSKAERTSRINR